ncbi:PIN domain-containing protein [Candidatus Microgenomates bacterium]|nr:PIN domain-containing protein [Candidatus Microgenomates bacterium]
MKQTKTVLIDTNYILRLLIGDIPAQLEEARKLFKQIEEKKAIGLLSILVVNELIWILEHFYEQKRDKYIPSILKLISIKNIKLLEVKKQQLVEILEEMTTSNLDYTDLYLLHLKKNLDWQIASFDKKVTSR